MGAMPVCVSAAGKTNHPRAFNHSRMSASPARPRLHGSPLRSIRSLHDKAELLKSLKEAFGPHVLPEIQHHLSLQGGRLAIGMPETHAALWKAKGFGEFGKPLEP